MMISLDLVPERIFIVHHGQVFLSNRRVPFQIRKLITCLVNEPCRKEDLVNRIWGYDYNPLRHDPMVLTLVQRAREVLGPFRKHLVVDQGIFELKPRFEWLRFEQIKTEKDRKSTRLNSSHSQQSRMPSSA